MANTGQMSYQSPASHFASFNSSKSKNMVEFDGARGPSQIVAAATVTFTVLMLAVLVRARVFPGGLRHRIPPGPRGWPVFGGLLSLGKFPHKSLYELSKQYGPIMFMHLGSVPTVVVSSPQMAQQILKTQDQIMASRPSPIPAIPRHITYNGADIVWAPYGQNWRNLRKICTLELLTAIRLRQFQGIRQGEVLASLHGILTEALDGKPVNVTKFFADQSFNNITQMVLGKRYSATVGISKSADGEESTVPELLHEILDLVAAVNIGDYVPIFKPLDLQGYKKRTRDLHKRVDRVLEDIIRENSQIGSSREIAQKPGESFVDHLLRYNQNCTKSEDCLSPDTLKAILLDMLNGSTDTSAASLEWVLSDLLRNPHLIRRAQEELDTVVGPHRLVDEADIPNLKYLQAVVKESFRLHPVLPLLIPHESMEDCEIAGYHIPAKTRIFVNVWGIQRDPAVWERPLEFDPDRFLNSTKDLKGQDFEILPFGSGRRLCPGMNLGLLMVQYPLAFLLHALNWALPDGQKPEDLDMSEVVSIVVRRAVPLKVLVKARLPAHVIYEHES